MAKTKIKWKSTQKRSRALRARSESRKLERQKEGADRAHRALFAVTEFVQELLLVVPAAVVERAVVNARKTAQHVSSTSTVLTHGIEGLLPYSEQVIEHLFLP